MNLQNVRAARSLRFVRFPRFQVDYLLHIYLFFYLFFN